MLHGDREDEGPRHVGTRVEVHDCLDSTNSRALALAEDPANAGVVVVARAQSSGRGQYGRTWAAPPGSSVLLSALIFPPPQLRRPVVLTAWAAVSVCTVVRDAIGQSPRVKWPNDVLTRGKKLCGILIEQRACADGRLATVVGIGLNVAQPAAWFESAGLPDAISLVCVLERAPEPDAIARSLIRALDEQYDRLLRGGLAALESSWASHLGLAGKEVHIQRHGDCDCRGKVRDVTFDGVQLEMPATGLIRIAPEKIKRIDDAARPA